MANKNSCKGFTLFELIIYIVIFGIIGTLGTAVFNFAVKEKVYVGRLAEVQIDATQAMSRLVAEVHNSASIASVTATTLTINMNGGGQEAFVFNGGALTFQVVGVGTPATVTSPNIILSSASFTLVSNPSPSLSSVQIAMTAGYNNNGTVDSNTLYSLRTSALPL